MNQVKSLVFFSIISVLLIFGCETSDKKTTKSPRVKSLSKIANPRNGSTFTIGDTIEFELTVSDPSIGIDSMHISHHGRIVSNGSQFWSTTTESPGKKNLLATVYLSNGAVEKKRHAVTMLSDLEPVRWTYQVTNTFVHDPDAFTEGLLFDQNTLYESTGEKGYSSLRKVDLKTGKIRQSIDISSQYFGEGIGVVNDKIYMLTYKERIGFIFNKNTLKQIGEFSYTTEGWGMTAIGDTLVMSDGSHILRFMEADGFSEVRQIEVYDQSGPIDFLNELEYINGDLFAVRWQTELIYIIDPQTGKVKGTIDLTGVFDYSKYERRIDVLNGIAHNKVTNKYYVTGKWWPKLFEIQLTPANNN